ncbi:MAG: GIY-YIG nuclease family protein [Candidatus Hodarchaeales archaeon]
MSYWVYFLLVGDKKHGINRKIYIGYTNHLVSRLIQHIGLSSTKGAKFTHKQIIEVGRLEIYKNKREAMQREWLLKHKSPFNQRSYKLDLILEFKSQFDNIIKNINQHLEEYFIFTNELVKSLNKTEKAIIDKMTTLEETN